MNDAFLHLTLALGKPYFEFIISSFVIFFIFWSLLKPFWDDYV